ncbi:MAG: phytoene desaturase family protein [Planctomycetota bacterium]
MNAKRVGVIGGGLGGLSAACVLAARGHEVVLFERNGWLGGKACVLQKDGFRFDMGPTILTLPDVLRRVFGEADRELEQQLDLMPLDPQWRCFFEDGRRLDLLQDPAEMAEALDEWAPGGRLGEGYRAFIDLSAEMHELSDNYFFWRPVGGFRDMGGGASVFTPGGLKDMLSLRPGSTVAGTVRRHLREKDVAQMADHFTQYVGSSPFRAPAVLCGIAHMQTEGGIWYPGGGIAAVPRALGGLVRDLGVEVRLNTDTARIAAEDGRVSGVETADGRREPFDAVVSNCDSVRTYEELLGGEAARRFRRKRRAEPACSGVVLYLGLDRAYEHLDHHNFVFSRDAREEFEAIYGRGVPAPDPTCYVCAPSRTDDSVAPDDGEALYVLVHTPHLRDQHDWEQMLPDYRETILKKLVRTGGMEDIADRVVCEAALTPPDIRDRYRTLEGAIYGLASHGRFSGAFKPNNRSPHLDGLYLAGGAAHPGAGMPMVLMSGWIAADALDADAVSNEE